MTNVAVRHVAIAVLLLPCLLMANQRCHGQEGSAEFASYSAEVFSSSSRRQNLEANGRTETQLPSRSEVASQIVPKVKSDAVKLEVEPTEPSLLAPPGSLEQPPLTPSLGLSAPMEFSGSLDTRTLLMKLTAGVVLSVSLCFGLMFVGTKLKGGDWMQSSGEMQLVDTLNCGQRCCLQLVRVQDRLVVVGRDASGIREIVPLSPSFEQSFDDRLDRRENVDQETLEFEKAAEALLSQKGIKGWNRTKQPRS